MPGSARTYPLAGPLAGRSARLASEPANKAGGTFGRRIRTFLAWMLPSAGLVLLPKCPACLAGYVLVWTGLGLSFSAATYLRWAMMIVFAGTLVVLVAHRLNRFRWFRLAC
jgi:hypothetical protein